MTDHNTNEQQRPYTEEWWWDMNGGQRIARIMMEMIHHNDRNNAHYSHDFVVMVAKCAFESGYNDGYSKGCDDGYDSCERHYNPDGLD